MKQRQKHPSIEVPGLFSVRPRPRFSRVVPFYVSAGYWRLRGSLAQLKLGVQQFADVVGMILGGKGAGDEGGHPRRSPAIGKSARGDGFPAQELRKGVQLRGCQPVWTTRADSDEQAIAASVHAAVAPAILTVTNQGQGLAPELASALFQPFTISQAMHYTQGTGLHLALADASVTATAYGAHIWATSLGVGQGSALYRGVARGLWREPVRSLISVSTRM